MILGYKKLKDCRPGQLVRLQDGSYLVLSEYRGDDGLLDAYISGSGENFASRDGDEWVAIIDLDWFELNFEDELECPNREVQTVHQVVDKKFIHGHCRIAEDELRHVATDNNNTKTLCGKNVLAISRGLINATCPECREIWYGNNPIDEGKENQ